LRTIFGFGVSRLGMEARDKAGQDGRCQFAGAGERGAFRFLSPNSGFISRHVAIGNLVRRHLNRKQLVFGGFDFAKITILDCRKVCKIVKNRVILEKNA
jgi:hypothetical protein